MIRTLELLRLSININDILKEDIKLDIRLTELAENCTKEEYKEITNAIVTIGSNVRKGIIRGMEKQTEGKNERD